MPAYNGLPYIKEAIDSVLSQEHEYWELLISNDNSSDKTSDYLNSLNDKRIQVYNQKQNLGIFDNLNFLINKSNYPVAKILCQDDRLLPGSLYLSLEFMNAHPACAVSRCRQIGDGSRFATESRHALEGLLPSVLKPDAAILALATFGCIIGNLTRATIRPKLILEAGGFDQNYPFSGDWEGWIRVASHFGIYLQQEELVFVRAHKKQNSILLDMKNENIPQTNALLQKLSTLVDSKYISILNKHWTIHFYSPRVSRALHQILSLEIRLAIQTLTSGPVNISMLDLFLHYIPWKFHLKSARKTTQILFDYIIYENNKND